MKHRYHIAAVLYLDKNRVELDIHDENGTSYIIRFSAAELYEACWHWRKGEVTKDGL